MFCSKCGKEIMDEAVVCPGCGCPVAGKSVLQAQTSESDTPNGGLNVLGFLIPLVGLIMYCTMVGKTPKKANQIGIFSLIGFIINLMIIIIFSSGV